MPMKRIFPFLPVLLLALSLPLHAQEDASYTVEASLGDSTAAGKVYLLDANTGLPIDSAVVACGRFRMEGTVPEPVLAMLSSPDLAVQGSFFLEPGHIRLRGQGESFLAAGTSLNDAFLKMLGELGHFAKLLSESPEQGLKSEIFTLKVDSVVCQVLEGHSNDLLGAVCLLQLAPAYIPPGRILELIRSTGSVVQGNPAVAAMRGSIERQLNTAEGKMFTDFSAVCEGDTVSLSDYVGKGDYVLADFWASWCGPCRREMPHMASIYNRYKGKGLVVLGIATNDKPADTRRAIEELGVTWPQILNAQQLPLEVYGISAIPHLILFAPDGTILARNLRGGALDARLEEVLGGTSDMETN